MLQQDSHTRRIWYVMTGNPPKSQAYARTTLQSILFQFHFPYNPSWSFFNQTLCKRYFFFHPQSKGIEKETSTEKTDVGFFVDLDVV